MNYDSYLYVCVKIILFIQLLLSHKKAKQKVLFIFTYRVFSVLHIAEFTVHTNFQKKFYTCIKTAERHVGVSMLELRLFPALENKNRYLFCFTFLTPYFYPFTSLYTVHACIFQKPVRQGVISAKRTRKKN